MPADRSRRRARSMRDGVFAAGEASTALEGRTDGSRRLLARTRSPRPICGEDEAPCLDPPQRLSEAVARARGRRSPLERSRCKPCSSRARSPRGAKSHQHQFENTRGMCSSLDGALEQRGDELALEDQEDDERRGQDQQRSGAQQRDVGAPLALEGAERAGHRPLRRVVDEHDRQAGTGSTSRGAAGSRARPSPGAASGTCTRQNSCHSPDAVDARRLRDLLGHVDEVGPHPEHRERHVQPDERQDDRPAGVEQPQVA